MSDTVFVQFRFELVKILLCVGFYIGSQYRSLDTMMCILFLCSIYYYNKVYHSPSILTQKCVNGPSLKLTSPPHPHMTTTNNHPSISWTILYTHYIRDGIVLIQTAESCRFLGLLFPVTGERCVYSLLINRPCWSTYLNHNVSKLR